MFKELDVVVVRALRSSTRHVAGTDTVKRQPVVGDEGAVVHVLAPGNYIVECVNSSGYTVWLCDFVEDELAAPPLDWRYSVEEISAGIYRATAIGPGEMRADATDADPTIALASCREFALRNSEPLVGGAG
jgi:uncharacterized protein DUF4926